jgi:hypothetical protein
MGELVASWALTPTSRYSSYGSGRTSQQLVVAASLLLVVDLVFVATALRSALALGWLAFLASRAGGVCQAQPSAALAHLSARLKSLATSWMSCVVSFSNISSSLTP